MRHRHRGQVPPVAKQPLSANAAAHQALPCAFSQRRGRVAEIVGRLLKKLGEQRQVMCITHLPQVAAAGDHQWQVAKSADPLEGGRVSSRIKVLDTQERTEEIARMLGGEKITDTTRKHAAEMLVAAGQGHD